MDVLVYQTGLNKFEQLQTDNIYVPYTILSQVGASILYMYR